MEWDESEGWEVKGRGRKEEERGREGEGGEREEGWSGTRVKVGR